MCAIDMFQESNTENLYIGDRISYIKGREGVNIFMERGWKHWKKNYIVIISVECLTLN